MGELTTRLYRNFEFLRFVKDEFKTDAEKNAAIKAFNWIKKRYPESVPIIRGELVSETKQEA